MSNSGNVDPDVEMELHEVNGQGRDGETEDVSLQPEPGSSKCSAFLNCFHKCTKPCLAESHPLPPQAPFYRRFADNLLCPPHSRMGAIIFIIFMAATMWTTVFSLVGDDALPGGNLFALIILFWACWCGGYVVERIGLPPLLGMLILGGILGNVPYINVARDIKQSWSSGCRLIALTVILIRAGLGLDPKALRRLSFVVIRLAFLPCLTEAFVDGIAAHLILGFPWPWAFMLGFVIAAVSPAVVVPSLLNLSDRGYGLDKGVPTLIIAAASIDDVLAITGFGVLLGITFSSGNIGWTLVKGPLEAIVGVLYGVVTGVITWYIPQKSSKHLILFRSSLLLFFCLMAIFGSKKIEWGGAGPLGALTMPFVAALCWRKEYPEGVKNPVENVAGILWMIFQPLLFGLIGSEVDIGSLDGDTIGLGIAVLCTGLLFRIVVSFFAVYGTNLSMRERFFVPIAWLPKATVQAAVGAVAYDTARSRGDVDDEFVNLGKQVLTITVLVILITAPLGSIGIKLAGPRLLNQTVKNQDEEEKGNDQANGIRGTHEHEDDVEGHSLIKAN